MLKIISLLSFIFAGNLYANLDKDLRDCLLNKKGVIRLKDKSTDNIKNHRIELLKEYKILGNLERLKDLLQFLKLNFSTKPQREMVKKTLGACNRYLQAIEKSNYRPAPAILLDEFGNVELIY